MNTLPVEGYLHLKRDIDSGAIMNTNITEYENYLKLKKSKEQERETIIRLTNDMNVVQSELSEIKTLLLKLVKNNE